MNDSKAENNKAIVLEAFDTLFNKRDYTAAERFWSPNYIQHSAHIELGRDGLFNLIRSIVKIRVDVIDGVIATIINLAMKSEPSLKRTPL